MRVIIFLSREQVNMLKNGITLHNINCTSATDNSNELTVVNMYKSFYEALSTTVIDGSYPDVVEVELMPGDIKCTIGVSTIASNVSWKYVVSVLYFEDCFYEGVATQSPCYRYINEVVNKATYHMCYSKDIVFREGYMYDWAYYLSDKVVKSEDINKVVAYTQNQVLKAFLDWWCSILVGYDLSICKNITITDLLAVLPEKVDLSAIHRFNLMSVSLCTRLGYTAFPTDTTEDQRCRMNL